MRNREMSQIKKKYLQSTIHESHDHVKLLVLEHRFIPNDMV